MTLPENLTTCITSDRLEMAMKVATSQHVSPTVSTVFVHKIYPIDI